MTVFHDKIALHSHDHLPCFHDVTVGVKKAIEKSGVKNGICLVYSHHTTCCVITQESSHDTNFYGREYMQQDLINIMEKLIPSCTSEGQYMHPGPLHIEFSTGPEVNDKAVYCLNTDAHLRSVIYGRSETLPIVDGKINLGDWGHIYFIDWDQVRERDRVCDVTIVGE